MPALRLQLLHHYLARSATAYWHEHDDDLAGLTSEREQIARSLHHQTLRLGRFEHHPATGYRFVAVRELA